MIIIIIIINSIIYYNIYYILLYFIIQYIIIIIIIIIINCNWVVTQWQWFNQVAVVSPGGSGSSIYEYNFLQHSPTASATCLHILLKNQCSCVFKLLPLR